MGRSPWPKGTGSQPSTLDPIKNPGAPEPLGACPLLPRAARHGIPAAHAAIPNLAPMVDVVMVILIFFMLGTTFAISEGILPTQLPSQVGPGGGAAITIVPSVRITLLEQPGGACKIVVMDRALDRGSFDDLAAFLREKRAAGADPTSPVLIAAEGGVQYQDVISAMDACVRAGFSNIQFALNPPTAKRDPSAGADTSRAP